MSDSSKAPITKEYFLKPGFIYLPEKATVISTVLGSSVSVLLCDRSLKIGGINHFLFPFAGSKEEATARYGNVAVSTLIRMMKANGAKKSKMQAQIFGGAFNSEYSSKDVGRANVNVARQILMANQIKIVSQDIGGELGRKIVFNTINCEIVTLKVEQLRKSDWYPYPAADR